MRLARFLLWLLRPLFWLLFPYRVTGRENIPPESSGIPTVLCSNHISDIDPPFLLICQKRHVHYMAKAELFRSRIANWFFHKQFGAFPVHRGTGDTSAIDTAVQLVKEGKMLGIFPEGTRSRDGRLGRARSGAALIVSRTGAQVLPVGIHCRGQKVRLFHMTTISFGEPIPFSELHLDDPKRPDLRYASRLIMSRIAALIGQVEEKESTEAKPAGQ
ncbi:MAG: 1-acyl-sn-glycerol-3-phosphate acyltransferase [Clostridiales bacterium]|nr:1-acyl-sn-glycerol-3-phosphate acyltransferase [Clostridiales bacterium]